MLLYINNLQIYIFKHSGFKKMKQNLLTNHIQEVHSRVKGFYKLKFDTFCFKTLYLFNTIIIVFMLTLLFVQLLCAVLNYYYIMCLISLETLMKLPSLRSSFGRDWMVVTVVTIVPSGMMVRSTSTFLDGVSEERSVVAL